MYLQSYDYQAARKASWKNVSVVRELIARRSFPYVHSEIQFGPRYGNISFSATMEDRAKCCRFKVINYTSGFWDMAIIPVTMEEEDLCFARAMALAGIGGYAGKAVDDCLKQGYLFGKEAKRYDLLGLLSFATPLEVIVPNRDRYWCSEAVATAIKAGRPDFNVEPDRLHPTALHQQTVIQMRVCGIAEPEAH